VALPESFLDHLRHEGYHPRSDKHSKALAEAIVIDLMRYCPKIATEAKAGRLVFQHNLDLTYGQSSWNTDLAIGQPPPGLLPDRAERVGGMIRATPSSTRIAVEAKSVMTEHRKAIKNRKRDLEAHHAHVHDYDQSTIAAGIIAINGSPSFQSPLRLTLTQHRNVNQLLTHCINEVNNITMAGGGHPAGLDAKCALVVVMDNVNYGSTAYLNSPPAPPIGSPIHWDSFIQRICNIYTARF
jgi:hypothetical protein